MKFYQSLLKNKMVANDVKKILHPYFEGLNSFFKKLFFGFENNKATVLITRRCSLLATWFLFYYASQFDNDKNNIITHGNIQLCVDEGVIFKTTDDGRAVKNYIITDKYISMLKMFNAEDLNIDIVDDICIHGRHLNSIKNKVTEVLRDHEVRTHVFMMNNTSKLSNVNYSVISTKSDWTDLSKKIVDVINYCNIPYASYITSFGAKISNEINYNILKSIDVNESSLFAEMFRLGRRNVIGQNSFFITEKNPKLLEIEQKKIVRYYYSENTGTGVFLPYVFLNPLSEEDLHVKYIEHCTRYLNEEGKKEFSKLNQEICACNDELKYNILTCIASYSYALIFFQKYLSELNIKNWEKDISKTILFSFGKKVSSIITNYKYYKEKIDYKEEIDYTNKSDYREENDASVLKLEDILNISTEILEYEFANRWIEKEKDALQNNLIDTPKYFLEDLQHNYNLAIKKRGIKISNLFNQYFYIELIRLCDEGLASISEVKNGSEVTCYADVGERGCALVLKYKSNFENKINELKNLSPYYRYMLD